MRTLNPDTLMPPFGTNEILSDQDMRDVVASSSPSGKRLTMSDGKPVLALAAVALALSPSPPAMRRATAYREHHPDAKIDPDQGRRGRRRL